jgi:hypothetical protein
VTRESGTYTSVVHSEQWIIIVSESQVRPDVTAYMNLIDSTIEFG